jgi:uncharacterized repeat protein (TIGR03803 family)
MRHKRVSIGIRAALILSTVPFLFAGSQARAQEKVLYSFDRSGKGGYMPLASLIFDGQGNLYGTAYLGGAHGDGTVFELVPKTGGEWTERVLHSFNSNGKDGWAPRSKLVFDASGNLYGTTQGGGAYGEGMAFELTPKAGGGWAEKVLHSFNGKDGYAPFAGLFLDGQGNLYGTTYSGGAYGWGTVFELTPRAGGGWVETVLHSFNGKDESYPQAGVVLDSAGNVYGAASDIVFELSPTVNGGWTEKVLHTFHSKYGTFPLATPIFDAAGDLLSTTYGGGFYGDGMAFELTPQADGDWTEKMLHSFNGKDGNDCYAGLIFDAVGNLFGATAQGGAYDDGTVFELTPKAGGGWIEKVLHNFNDNGKDGFLPDGGLISDAQGNLYGTTHAGGTHQGGTVFEITP